MKRLLLMVWIASMPALFARAEEPATPAQAEVSPPAVERLPRSALTPEPGVRGLGLGSAWNRGLDGVITGVCPGGTSPNAIGSAGLAPLSPIFVPTYDSALGAPTLDNQTFGGNSPIYGATYGENLGTAPGSVLAQSSALLGTPCPPTGAGVPLPAAPVLNVTPLAPPIEDVQRPH